MKKIVLTAALLSAFASQASMAAEHVCSSEAMMAANADLQEQFKTYAQARAADGADPDNLNGEMLEIMQSAGMDETIATHRDELDQMGPDADHQPSQALCDDMYGMWDRMSDEMEQRL